MSQWTKDAPFVVLFYLILQHAVCHSHASCCRGSISCHRLTWLALYNYNKCMMQRYSRGNSSCAYLVTAMWGFQQNNLTNNITRSRLIYWLFLNLMGGNGRASRKRESFEADVSPCGFRLIVMDCASIQLGGFLS